MTSAPRLDRDAMRWSAPLAAERPLLVLLHGRGSNEEDLFGLAPLLPAELVVVSLRAPHVEALGHSWVPPRPTGVAEPPEHAIAGAVAAVLEWLDELPARAATALLGFSQGGAMTVQLLRERPAAFACGVVLSGFVFEGDHPGDDELARRSPPVFWGRGTRDLVIEPRRIARTSAFLGTHTSLVERTYATGHSVTPSEVRDVSGFLADHLLGP